MKSLTTFAVVLAFSLCGSTIVYAKDNVVRVNMTHHSVGKTPIPSNTIALSPTRMRDRDSDGLSRNHDDCNRGCTDY